MRRAGRNLIREVGAETDWGPAAVLPLGVGWGQGDEPVERQVPRQGATRDPATIPRASHHPPDAAAASLQAAAKRTHNYEPYGWRRPGKTTLGTALARRSLTQKRSQGPPLRGPVGSHVSCRGTAGSATAGPPRATDCPARVQNPCPKSTSHNQRCHRILRPSPHGPPAGLRPRLHRRSASTPAGRRPHGDRLFPGDHRDRQRRHPHRPPHPQAAPGPAAPRRHPLVVWKLDRWPARCATWSRPSLNSPSAASGFAACRRRSIPPPRRQARLSRVRRPGRVRTRPVARPPAPAWPPAEPAAAAAAGRRY
jgi:hypothetical protein